MFVNNIDADQPAHLYRLISAFVFRLLDSIIPKLASSKLSMFYLVSETPKTGFVTTRPIFCVYFIPQDLSDLKETIDLLNLALTRNLARSIVIEGTTVHK